MTKAELKRQELALAIGRFTDRCETDRNRTPAPTAAYTITPARYSKGKMAVRCPGRDGYKTRACYLAERLSNHRYTNRERAYIMSVTAAARFERLYAEGWDVTFSGVLTPPRQEEGIRS